MPRYIIQDDCYRCSECCALPGQCDCPDEPKYISASLPEPEQVPEEKPWYFDMIERPRTIPAPFTDEYYNTYGQWAPPGVRPY